MNSVARGGDGGIGFPTNAGDGEQNGGKPFAKSNPKENPKRKKMSEVVL